MVQNSLVLNSDALALFHWSVSFITNGYFRADVCAFMLYSFFCVLSNKVVQDLNTSNKLAGGNFFRDQFQIKLKK